MGSHTDNTHHTNTHKHTHLGVETADFPEVLQSGQDPLAASLQLSDAALEPPHLAVVPVLGQAGQEGAWQEGAEQGGRGYNDNSQVAVLISTRDLPNETLHTPQPDSPPHSHLTPHTAPSLPPHSHTSHHTLHLCTGEVEDLQVCVESMVQCVWWAVVPLGQSPEHVQHLVGHHALLVVLSQTAGQQEGAG